MGAFRLRLVFFPALTFPQHLFLCPPTLRRPLLNPRSDLFPVLQQRDVFISESNLLETLPVFLQDWTSPSEMLSDT